VQSADEVTQSPASKEVTEGQSVIIDCSYKTSNFYAMQWYKQPINGGSPKYINKATGSSKHGDYSGKYQPEVVTSEKRGTLRITPTADDSAIYYCAIEATTVTRETLHSSKNLQQKSKIRAEDTVTQSTEGVFVHEGGSVTLSCNYTTSDTTAELFWYIQRQSDSPKYMMRENTYGKGHTAPEFKRRFTAVASKTKTEVPLTIEDVQLCDSAVYYCALKPTVTVTL
ncbi:hypothetical protein Z043_125841, partial [Scleropages formosus]